MAGHGLAEGVEPEGAELLDTLSWTHHPSDILSRHLSLTLPLPLPLTLTFYHMYCWSFLDHTHFLSVLPLLCIVGCEYN